ncbi:MAG TPA: MBL fold metallo-hydrolase [Gallionellaceae bacterium]|nr:MBL fold metallo-hydrolase [Gallionellaceae bacterium]
MEIAFLGTSSGTPTKERNVSGLALTVEGSRGWYLVDCGEATQHQLLHTSLSTVGLKAVFITHVHGDHCYGLPGLLASAAMAGRTVPLQLVAPEGIAGWIDATCALTALHLPFELKFTPTESLAVWRDEDVVVEAIPLSHRVPSYAYSFTEAKREARLNTGKLIREGVPQGPLWGRLKAGERIEHSGRTLLPGDYLHYPNEARRIVVAGDNDQPELLREACAEAQVLVHEATYTREVAARNDNAFQHCTAERIAAFAESAGLPNLVLTHFSARYQADTTRSPSIADIQMEAAARYHGGLFLAEDFARYRLSKKGEFELAG